MHGSPQIAIINHNTLAVLGLKSLLNNVIPGIVVDTFATFDELSEANVDDYYHYFVAVDIVLGHRTFFLERRRKTIVLVPFSDTRLLLGDFHCLCTNVSESKFVKSLLLLEQVAHAHGRNLPPAHAERNKAVLSYREAEVLVLIVKGFINKEIADRLNIGLTTVITHRRNIMDKLKVRSVSALTIYAVMNGYVDINNI